LAILEFIGKASLVFIGTRESFLEANKSWLSNDSEDGIEVAPILCGVDCAKKSLALIEEISG
jgi:hypothetical protein